MRLTKLELQGFKSFADHTFLQFDKGATAIVGPNGCGKSNVSDAIRWVLGEQRARMLRGGSMTEVIFQGSSARRPVNVAEVSLHFDNREGTLPVPFKEVVITRRLSRSGESEYFLNRTACRLRDIQDLMRGTGLGADSGVVIESKMIDALLSDRPDDRRELFEEAAGVGLYRDRRRSTERRLEETSVDLSRLDDLINEVASQTRALARQRKRAERHAELTARRFNVELTLAGREMAEWKDELARLDARLAELQLLNPQAEATLAEFERARESAQQTRANAEAQRAELARIVAGERQTVLQLQGELAVAEERQRNATSRRSRAEEEQKEGEALGLRVAEERERAIAERAQCEETLSGAAQELAERAALEEETRRAVASARQRVEQAERSARELREQARRLEIDREATQREEQEVGLRRAALDTELAALADRMESVQREMAAAAEALELAREQVAQAQFELDEARLAVRAARDGEAGARAELARADEMRTSIQGKINGLEALERDRVGLAPAAARLLKERQQFGDGAVLGPLSDFVTAGSDAAVLVERFLGATVHAVVVRDREVADRIRGWHAAANLGPLLLLPADAIPATSPFAGATTPDGVAVDATGLAARVRAAEPAGSWVRALLGGVEVLGEGSAFVDARGAMLLPGQTSGPGPLRRRAELGDLRTQLEASDARREEARQALEAARTALAAAEAQQAVAAEASTVAQQEARRADDQRAELERRRQRADRELADAQQLAARLSQRVDELAERARALEARAGDALAQAEAREQEAADARGALAESEHQLETAREERTVWQVEQAQAQARLQVAVDRERRLSHEIQTQAQRLESLQRELSSLATADSALAEQMSVWALDLESKRQQLQDVEERLTDAEQAVQGADEALRTAEQALADVRRSNGALADEFHTASLRHTQLAGRRDALRERLETEWRRPLDDLLASFEAVDVEADVLRTELDELRGQLEQLGVVNPLAIDEHEEEVRRLDFLTGQRTDLAQARASLQQAIKEIDTTARELFLATFAQARENFRQIFMTLFGGGECDLRLENPDTPLDCDIEIHASPRGKRTQRIHLLSSGERALVALSLLFGIFLTKPSPFCLLDEVDAPLDDQNVGRYVRMLNQFKTKTQFIIITHNPRTTTEAADAVYGVTMQEPGVSSLVSVRLRGGPQVDAAPAEPSADAGDAAVDAERDGAEPEPATAAT